MGAAPNRPVAWENLLWRQEKPGATRIAFGRLADRRETGPGPPIFKLKS